MQRTLDAGCAFRNGVVCDEQVRVMRKSFQIAIVAVGVAAECDADTIEFYAIRDGGYASVDNVAPLSPKRRAEPPPLSISTRGTPARQIR